MTAINIITTNSIRRIGFMPIRRSLIHQEKPADKTETWAEDARDDLEDWIEGQGIQLRY